MKKSVFLIAFIIYGCSPYLSDSKIIEKVNNAFQVTLDERADFTVQNTPSAYFDLNKKDRDVLKKEYAQFYRDQSADTDISWSDIKDVHVSDRLKCNNQLYYKIKYNYTKTEITPYLDSTALSLNIESYGKENVFFDKLSSVLTLNITEESIIVLDKDKSWKILPIEGVDNDTYYGTGFSKCVQKN